MPDILTPADVAEAAARIAPWIRRTPTMLVQGPGARPVYLKLETLQRSGSFKLRGALNKLMQLGAEARRGVVTASGGNHGLGVAWAGWLLGVPVHVCVPSTTPRVKQDALAASSASVELVPGSYPHAEIAARSYARAHELAYIHAYDDAAVIAGQGTAIAELLEDAPGVRTVVIPIGGGGLVAGAVLAAEGRRVVGVEPYGAATMHTALRAGGPVNLALIDSVAADALGAGRAGALAFDICSGGLDRVELVEDAAILEARRWIWDHLRLVVEPGASTALAALATGLLDDDPGPVAMLLCGANTDPSNLLA